MKKLLAIVCCLLGLLVQTYDTKAQHTKGDGFIYMMEMDVQQTMGDSVMCSKQKVLWGIKGDTICFAFEAQQTLCFVKWEETNEHDTNYEAYRRATKWVRNQNLNPKHEVIFLVEDVWDDKYAIAIRINQDGIIIFINKFYPKDQYPANYILSMSPSFSCDDRK